MVLHRVLVTDTSAFDAAVAAAVAATPDATFVLLVGAPADGVSGASWCSDTNVARPVLEAVLAEAAAAADLTVVECSVPRAGYKGVPTHPYRLHPVLQLKGVPTLIKWGSQGKLGELVEPQCADAALVRELVRGR